MKIAISLICGAAISALIIIGVKPILPTYADTTQPSINSENATQSIIDQISGFDKMFREALTEPFIKAESKITDPDIAEYYHGLMEKTGLTNPNR